MTLAELRALILLKLREESTSTFFSSTLLNALINEVYYDIAKRADWEWLVAVSKRNGIYTTLASDQSSTTIAPTSYSNMWNGQGIHLSNGTVYEYTEINGTPGASTSIDTTNFPLTTSFVAGDYVYSNNLQLPSDFNHMLQVTAEKISSGVQSRITLKQSNMEDMAEYASWPLTAYGDPEEYWVDNKELFIYPLPSAVWKYYVRYIKNITSLSGDSDTPLLPSEYHYLLVDGVCKEAMMLEVRGGDESRMGFAQYYAQKYEDGLSKMLAVHNARRMRYASFSLSDDNELPSWR